MVGSLLLQNSFQGWTNVRVKKTWRTVWRCIPLLWRKSWTVRVYWPMQRIKMIWKMKNRSAVLFGHPEWLKLQMACVTHWSMTKRSARELTFKLASISTLPQFLDALASLAFKLKVSKWVTHTFFRSSIYTMVSVSKVSTVGTVGTVSQSVSQTNF